MFFYEYYWRQCKFILCRFANCLFYPTQINSGAEQTLSDRSRYRSVPVPANTPSGTCRPGNRPRDKALATATSLPERFTRDGSAKWCDAGFRECGSARSSLVPNGGVRPSMTGRCAGRPTQDSGLRLRVCDGNRRREKDRRRACPGRVRSATARCQADPTQSHREDWRQRA